MSFDRAGGLPDMTQRPQVVHIAVRAPVTRADVAGLSRRAARLLAAAPPARIECDVRGLTGADAAAVDALAHIALQARRAGCDMRLLNACDDLCRLVALAGLTDALGAPAPPPRDAPGGAGTPAARPR